MEHRASRVLAAMVAAGWCTSGAPAAAAWSAWTTGDDGLSTPVRLTVIAAPGDPDLSPGFTDGDLSFVVHNPTDDDITFTSMRPGLVTSSAPLACPASNVRVEAARGLVLRVRAHASSDPLTLHDVVTLRREAPDGCQGVEFHTELVLEVIDLR